MVEELGEKLEGKAEVVTCMVSQSTRGDVSRVFFCAMYRLMPRLQCPCIVFGLPGASNAQLQLTECDCVYTAVVFWCVHVCFWCRSCFGKGAFVLRRT